MEITGALHLHSTHSYDGKMSLPELKVFFQKQGLSFACMSEHTDELNLTTANNFISECRALSDEQFVFVPGFEVPYKNTHVLMFGCTDFVSSFADADQLRAWSFNASLTILAHPVRNRFVVDDDLLSVLDGVEIWNQQYEGKQFPRYRSCALLDNLRQQKPQLFATGGIDLHRSEHFGSPLVSINSESIDETKIIEALQSGQYSFGHESLMIKSNENWSPSGVDKVKSQLHILTINSGKWMNKTLARLGLSFPKSLKQLVRRFV
jgi:hypothetical protein